MKILYLYAEVMGYTMATLFALVDRGADVHVVHWDHKKVSAYQPPNNLGLTMYKRSGMDKASLQRLADELQPDITVVSGWMDKDYVAIAKKLRASDRVVVTGLDGQWLGTLRQRAAVLLGKCGYFKAMFSHAWVCGPYQYEFARRLGFRKDEIVFDLYSADTDLFRAARLAGEERKRRAYPHRFLFVGRFERVKGLDTLLRAWELLGEDRGGWELHLIGSGSLKSQMQGREGIVVKDFMQPVDLMREVTDIGCFILPSRYEPWGVVVHEFAAAGLPIVASDAVGAASHFLIHGRNGYTFKANNVQSLMQRMRQIISLSEQELLAMAELSHQLSLRISPKTSADNLLSLA